jgi:hypothetical protein
MPHPEPDGCGARPRSLPDDGIESGALGSHRAPGPTLRRVQHEQSSHASYGVRVPDCQIENNLQRYFITIRFSDMFPVIPDRVSEARAERVGNPCFGIAAWQSRAREGCCPIRRYPGSRSETKAVRDPFRDRGAGHDRSGMDPGSRSRSSLGRDDDREFAPVWTNCRCHIRQPHAPIHHSLASTHFSIPALQSSLTLGSSPAREHGS